MSVVKPFIAVVTIMIFIVLLFGTFGGAKYLDEDMNMTEDDLRFTPNIPDAEPQQVELDSFEDSENVEIRNFENETHPDAGSNDLNGFMEGIGLEENASEGYVVYDLPDGEEIETFSSRATLLEFYNCNIEGTVGIDNSEETASFCGYTTEDMNKWDESRIVFDITEQDRFIYQITVNEQSSENIIGITIEYFNASIEYMQNWFTVAQNLPTFLQATLGTLITAFFALMILMAVTFLQ